MGQSQQWTLKPMHEQLKVYNIHKGGARRYEKFGKNFDSVMHFNFYGENRNLRQD